MTANDSDDDRTQTYIILTKGTKVSHYTIISKIGAGGMGEVYLAEDSKLKRKVALKFLPAKLSTDADFKARFVREAEATAKLNHPNIVTIYEVSEYNGRPFFAMELVEGQSLRDLAKGKELGLDRIVELAIQICDGLSAAHGKQVVHRDIKPSNIVIDAYGRPKILDFGLAAIQGGEQLTKTGSTLGTVRYMSPEQVQGKQVDHRSDLFSLGIVLFELITGRTPFEKDNEGATLKAITQDNPEPIARYKSDIPDELQRTVSKLLEKDPSMRYQTAGGVLSDLKRLIAPTQSSMAPLQAKKKNSLPLVIGGLVIIALLAVVGMKYWPASESKQVSSSPPERKMLAVLPFENLGNDEDEGFADGITGAITSRINKISGLGVIARTSILQYKGTTKRIQEIGSELGVEYVLEGTILWDKTGDTTQIRIIPQLIKVSDESPIWTDTYERALNQIFAIQGEIATSIAENLDVTLLKPEQDALTDRPTENLEAYTYYLRGLAYRDERKIELAEEMMLKSISLDTTFAEAYAELSYLNSYQYFYRYFYLGTTGNEVELAKTYAEKAYELNPEGTSSLIALGYYAFYVEGNYTKALSYFEKGLEVEPNNAELLGQIGALSFRYNQHEKAYVAYKRAVALEPGNVGFSGMLGYLCLMMRKGEEAIEVADQALEYNPDALDLHIIRTMVASLYHGSPTMVRQFVEEAISYNDDFTSIYVADMMFLDSDWLTGDYEKIVQEVKAQGLKEAKTLYDTTNIYYNQLASLYYFLNDTINMKIYADSLIQKHMTNPENMGIRNIAGSWKAWDLSLAHILLGNKTEGLRILNEAIEFNPIDRDGHNGAWAMLWLSQNYMFAKEYETALDMIEMLLSRPSPLNVAFMKISPTYDPLRDHPRFKALIEKYDRDQDD